jgi:hypothetical protein
MLIEQLTRQERIPRDDLRPLACWLVRALARRGPLKLGIILLGLSKTEADVPDLLTLARHDELTLHAAVAQAKLSAWWKRTARAMSCMARVPGLMPSMGMVPCRTLGELVLSP